MTTPSSRSIVLLVNLGTPADATAWSVARFLQLFLSDQRVVEIPKFAWLPVLYGIILPLRAFRVAKAYRAIWLKEGSPLRVYTEQLATKLQSRLNNRDAHVDVPIVRHAMRYGDPSIEKVLSALSLGANDRLTVYPLFPQYCASTTATIFDVVSAYYQQQRNMPSIQYISNYSAHPFYIEALVKQIHDHRPTRRDDDHLLFSFHGMPVRTLRKGDPYAHQCYDTAHRLAQALKLSKEQWSISFQSRFGPEPWLTPDTEFTLEALAQKGIKHVDVLCPGFSTDCLETLEEINLDYRQTFLDAGGASFHYIPALNSSDLHVELFAKLIENASICPGSSAG